VSSDRSARVLLCMKDPPGTRQVYEERPKSVGTETGRTKGLAVDNLALSQPWRFTARVLADREACSGPSATTAA
jgi:hypothetical protein